MLTFAVATAASAAFWLATADLSAAWAASSDCFETALILTSSEERFASARAFTRLALAWPSEASADLSAAT